MSGLSVRLHVIQQGHYWALYSPSGNVSCMGGIKKWRAEAEEDLKSFLYNFNNPNVSILDIDKTVEPTDSQDGVNVYYKSLYKHVFGDVVLPKSGLRVVE